MTMPVYTVHAPITGGADLRATDRFVFVRDGFRVWAAIFGVLWLAWQRLWLATIGWIVVLFVVDLLLAQIGVGPFAILLVDGLLALLLGLEASSVQRWSLSRRDWRQLDLVIADDVEAAERRFFERWTIRRSGLPLNQAPTDRGAAPPTRDLPRPPPLPAGGIIGLFPEPGGSR
jgi:hypothetical protein